MRVRLRHERLQRELAKSRRSQNAWAEKLGLDSGHFSKLVNGRRRYPGASTRKKLLEGLGLEFEDLFVVETRSRRASRRNESLKPNTRKEAARNMGHDLQYALRMMRKQPGFAALAVFILALGVGANSAVFSLVDAVLLDPIPFAASDHLVMVWSSDDARGAPGPVSFPDYLDWTEQNESFSVLGAFADDSFILGGEDGAERVLGEMATPEYFEALGAETILGRTPTVEEAEPVVILNESLAERRFGRASAILGRPIQVNDQSFTVIGIFPRAFRGFSGTAELWLPMRQFDVINPELVRYDILGDRGTRWHGVIGRLLDGVGLAEAQSELNTIAGALSKAYPDTNASRAVTLRSAYDEVVLEHRSSLVLLSVAVGVLLLLACVNLASLFLLRVLSRRGEVAVRVALGADRPRLVRQLLTESVLFAVVGGAIGLLVARFSLRVLLALAPVSLPGVEEIGLDLRVFGFALGMSVATGIAVGIFPALTASSVSLNSWLRLGGRSGTKQRRALASFAFAEIAIATILLVGAGLVIKSLYRMQLFEPGFISENLLTLRVHVPADVAEPTFLQQIVDEAARIPGVTSAALSSHIYFGGGYMSGDLTVEGFEASSPDKEINAYHTFVTDDYFRTLGIPWIRGDGFERAEQAVVVNESFAKRMWPNEDPIGKRLVRGSKGDDKPWLTVVGVVGDVKPRLRLTTANALPQIYFRVDEGGEWSRGLVVRTATAPASVVEPLLRTLRELHPGIAVFSIATMDELLSTSRASLRYVAYLMGVFAALALVLASLGLYGVIAYAVGQLTREIAVRLAVGATRGSVVGLVMKRAMAIVAVGLATGLIASFASTRLASSLLYEVDPLDPVTFAAVAVGMWAVVLLAGYLPARGAASVDPVVTLRHE